MKNYLLLLFYLCPQILFSQIIKCEIRGNITNLEGAKYAYLFVQGEPIIKNQITGNSFSFLVTDTLREDGYKFAYLFLDDRDNVTEKEININLLNRTWTTNRPNNVKYIIIEDLTLKIENTKNTRNAIIVNDGVLNNLLLEFTNSLKTKTIKEFIIKYPKAPMSLDAIIGIITYFNLTMDNSLGTPKELFELLSDCMKNTKKGLKIKSMLNEL